MVKAELEDIAVMGDGTDNPTFVVLLRTEPGDIVPIWIDVLQAQAIALGRAKETFPRPLTHDLLLSVVEMLGGELKRIEITDLKSEDGGGGIYYAKLILENRGIESEIDARPSDALALAVRCDAPLLVAEHVVEQGAMVDDLLGGPGGVEA